jgi:hypothetical protein
MCANKAQTQVGRRREYEVPPSSTNVREGVPPAFAAPFSAQQDARIVAGFVFIEENGSRVIKYVEK